MAVAFIAFFGVVAVAVGRWTSTDQLAFKHTETVASGDALAEGQATYAAASLARGDAPVCSTSSSTSYSRLSFGSGGDVLQLHTVACPTPAGGVSSGGANCAVCILDTASVTSMDNEANLSVQGDVYINANLFMGNLSVLTATPSAVTHAPGAVLVHGTTTYDSHKPGSVVAAGGFTPSGASSFGDPLASGPPAPLLLGTPQALPNGGGGATMSPGIFKGGTITGDLTLQPGTYEFIGDVKVTGNANIVGTGVTLYFACGNADGTAAAACSAPGATTSGLDYEGNGKITIDAPTTGAYAGMALFVDRGNSGAVTVKANGLSEFTGVIYAPLSVFTINNNALQFTKSRLIVKDLVNNGGGTLTVGGNYPFALSCAVVDSVGTATIGSGDKDILNANPQPTTYGQSRVVVQTACSGGTGIVDFNYGP
jgi:hypothetical protein